MSQPAVIAAPATGTDLLRASGLVKHYPLAPTLRERVDRAPRRAVHALDGVDLAVARGESVAIVGESGSGKTTLARLLLMIEPPDAGSIVLEGVELVGASRSAARASRQRMQAVFQDPASSLNPRRRAWDLVTHPLRTHGVVRGRRARRAAAVELLEMVELRAADGARLPHELSLGQRQRLAIARALALRPSLVIADEPVSALDVSIQAQILVLLERLQHELGLSYVFVSHDLRVVRHLCRRVYVMYAGQVVEQGTVEEVFAHPHHPYTQRLLASVPRLDGTIAAPRPTGDVVIPEDAAGCRFADRCADVQPGCLVEEPPLADVGEARLSRCLVPPEERCDEPS